MSFVKEVGLIIDLHQSPVQEESVFKKAVTDLYIPLIRLIKSKRDMKITLSIPLSTLELLDKYGFGSLISEIKDLCAAERVDLVGASAYGALLDDLPNDVIENQIILNEYAMGYYLGARQGFEGEPSIMIKDLQGFVPSHFYINNQILKIAESLGYRWMLTSNYCLPEKYQKPGFGVYKVIGSDVGILKLDEEIIDISNSYGKESVTELKKKISDKLGKEWRTNLFYVGNYEDGLGELAYKKEFELVDVLIETLEELKVAVVNVTDVLDRTDIIEIGGKEDIGYQNKGLEDKENLLSFYFNGKDEKLASIKSIENELLKIRVTINDNNDLHDLFTLPIWKEDAYGQISDSFLQHYICYFILLSKFMSFDKYIQLNHYFSNIGRLETHLSKLHSFTLLATRSLSFVPEYSEKSKLLSEIELFSKQL